MTEKKAKAVLLNYFRVWHSERFAFHDDDLRQIVKEFPCAERGAICRAILAAKRLAEPPTSERNRT